MKVRELQRVRDSEEWPSLSEEQKKEVGLTLCIYIHTCMYMHVHVHVAPTYNYTYIQYHNVQVRSYDTATYIMTL